MDLGLPPLRREPTVVPGRYIKPLLERSSVRTCITSVLTFVLMGLQNAMTWQDVGRACLVSVLTTFLAIYTGKDSEGTVSPPRSNDGPPPAMMALLAFCIPILLVVGCATKPYVPPPSPDPVPVPTPGPTPVPVPPPAPAGRVLTVAEYDGVEVGKTQETAILAAYGAPWRRTSIGTPGTSALLYFAKDPEGRDRVAEFWVRDGVVVNKNRL